MVSIELVWTGQSATSILLLGAHQTVVEFIYPDWINSKLLASNMVQRSQPDNTNLAVE